MLVLFQDRFAAPTKWFRRVETRADYCASWVDDCRAQGCKQIEGADIGQSFDTEGSCGAKPLITMALPSGIEPLSPP